MDFNQICEEMKERIEKEYAFKNDNIGLSAKYAYFHESSNIYGAKERLETEKALDLSKLADVLALTNQSVEVQEKFIAFKGIVDGYKMPEKRKIQWILTSAGILNRFDSSVLNMDLLRHLAQALSDEKSENYLDNEHTQILLGLFNSKGDFLEPSESEKTI